MLITMHSKQPAGALAFRQAIFAVQAEAVAALIMTGYMPALACRAEYFA